MSDEVIRLGASQTLRVLTSTADLLELESTWTTGGDPPQRHYHPAQDETFGVLEGELTVEVGSEPARVLAAGEVVEIPRRTAHRMWNAGSVPTRATGRVTPAMRTEEMFRFIDQGLSPVRTVTLVWRFRREFRPSLGRKG